MGRKCGCGRRQRPTPTLPLPLAQPEPHILCTPTPKVYFTEKNKKQKASESNNFLIIRFERKAVNGRESVSERESVCASGRSGGAIG